MIRQRRFGQFAVYCRDGLDHLLSNPVRRLVCSIRYPGTEVLPEARRIRSINSRLLKKQCKSSQMRGVLPCPKWINIKLPPALIMEGNGMNLLLQPYTLITDSFEMNRAISAKEMNSCGERVTTSLVPRLRFVLYIDCQMILGYHPWQKKRILVARKFVGITTGDTFPDKRLLTPRRLFV